MNKTVMILGGDGYIGWSLGLYRAFHSEDQVILVDSYLKRDLQESLGIKELYELPFLPDRIRSYSVKTGKHNLLSLSVDVANYAAIESVISRYKPDVIVNAAHQPSAPFSMTNPQNAALTLTNNEKTCLNVLWAVRDHCPESVVINLGSAGVFQSVDSSFIPETKKILRFYHHGMLHSVFESWLPMQASDFYHQSKVHTFGITEMASEIWKLKTITVQQSIIFGQCVDATLKDPNLCSRFNYDHIFGTVLNRFACQAVKGSPLTIYGNGIFQTNIICLRDALENLNNLIELDIVPGSHKVINNFSESISIKEIAQKVIEIYGKGDIEYIENPRVEKNCSQIKTFENSSILSKLDIEDSIRCTLDFTEHFCHNVDINQFKPMVKWAR